MNQSYAQNLALSVRLRETWWFWPLVIVALILTIPWLLLLLAMIIWLVFELLLTGLAIRQLAKVRK